MGRPRHFTREDVLEKAIPVFWERGYADTGLHDLEEATGVNKSGLYAEFKSKEEIFLACLRYYLERMGGKTILSREPLGWKNIEDVLKMATACSGAKKGCFATNSMREFTILPRKAHQIVSESNAEFKRLLRKNIQAERTKMDADAVADIVSTFLSGLCVQQNLKMERACSEQKIENLLRMLRAL